MSAAAVRMRKNLKTLSMFGNRFDDGGLRENFNPHIRDSYRFPLEFRRAERRRNERRESSLAGDDGEMRQPPSGARHDGHDVRRKRFGKRRDEAFDEGHYGRRIFGIEIRERDEFSRSGSVGQFRPGNRGSRFDADLWKADFDRTAGTTFGRLRSRTEEVGADDRNGTPGFP